MSNNPNIDNPLVTPRRKFIPEREWNIKTNDIEVARSLVRELSNEGIDFQEKVGDGYLEFIFSTRSCLKNQVAYSADHLNEGRYISMTIKRVEGLTYAFRAK